MKQEKEFNLSDWVLYQPFPSDTHGDCIEVEKVKEFIKLTMLDLRNLNLNRYEIQQRLKNRTGEKDGTTRG